MRISDWSSDVCSSDLLLDDSSVQQYFRRSDHFALVKRGVPMVMLTGIFSREREKDDAIDRYFERDYHQAGDELEAVPSFDGAAEDVEAALRSCGGWRMPMSRPDGCRIRPISVAAGRQHPRVRTRS